MIKLTWMLTGSALSLGLGVLSPASAQVVPSNDENDEELVTGNEIVVTAQRREQSLLEVPVAITALSGDYLDETQTTGFEDLQRLVPSLTFQTGASDRDGTVAIRGIGTSGRINELDPSVGLFIDGVFMDRTGNGVGDFIDIERVEVLRGPQGTLFGKNTPAGIVHFITKDPTFNLEGELRASYGNYDELKTSGTLSGPLIGDTVAARISYFTNNRDGFYLNTVTGSDLRNRDRYGVRGKVLIEPSPEFTLILSGDYGKDDELGPGGDLLTSPFDFQVAQNTDGVVTAERWGVSATADIRLADHTLTLISAYRSYEAFRNQDADFGPVDGIPILKSNPDQEHYTQEIRLASPTDGNFDYILGFYFFDKKLRNELETKLGAGLFGGRLDRQGEDRVSEFDNTAYAFFGHANYRFADDRFNLFGGLRYTIEEKTQVDVATITPLARLAGFSAFNERETFDDSVLTYTAGLQYFPNDDVMGYASIATGYKSGGTSAANKRFNPPRQSVFQPERSTNYEVGLKSTFFDRRAGANLAVFYTEFEDFQATQFNAANNSQIQSNVGGLETYGVELDAYVRPVRGLSLSVAAAYIDATYTDFIGAVPNAAQQLINRTDPTAPNPRFNPANNTQDLTGQPLPNSPKWTVSGTARYEQPISASVSLFGQAEAFYRSSAFLDTDLDPNLFQEGYTLANFRLGLETDNFSISAYLENAFEEDYFIAGGDIPTFGGGGYFVYAGDPRTYGLQVGIRF